MFLHIWFQDIITGMKIIYLIEIKIFIYIYLFIYYLLINYIYINY